MKFKSFFGLITFIHATFQHQTGSSKCSFIKGSRFSFFFLSFCKSSGHKDNLMSARRRQNRIYVEIKLSKSKHPLFPTKLIRTLLSLHFPSQSELPDFLWMPNMEFDSCLCIHSKVGGIKQISCDKNIFCIMHFVLCVFAVDLFSFCPFSLISNSQT